MPEAEGVGTGNDRSQQALAIGIAGLLGQAGCVTVGIIGLALAAGLWLDSQFATRPLLTVLLVLGSVPITLYLMVRMVLGGMNRLGLSAGAPELNDASKEEADVGGTT